MQKKIEKKKRKKEKEKKRTLMISVVNLWGKWSFQILNLTDLNQK